MNRRLRFQLTSRLMAQLLVWPLVLFGAIVWTASTATAIDPPSISAHDDASAVWITDDPPAPMTHAAIEPMEMAAVCECGHQGCQGVCREPGHPEKPLIDRPGDRSRADNPPRRYQMGDCQRTGAAKQVHRFAKCSTSEKYSAWFVGGGAAFCRGRCRTPAEGTWGLDYSGIFGKANVWLKYTRGRKQGGEGDYRTDGEPKIVTKTNEFLGIGH